jgi:hypothetical protein
MINRMTANLFVVSPCFLYNIDDSINSHYKVLFLFIEHEHLNVAIDKNNEMLSIYQKIAENRQDIALMGWLRTMSKKPESFKRIIEIHEKKKNYEELCLYICRHIVNKKKPIIVWDRQDYVNYTFDDNNEIEYDGCKIWYINWNEMGKILEEPKIIIDKALIGDGTMIGGDVSDSTIKNIVKK